MQIEIIILQWGASRAHTFSALELVHRLEYFRFVVAEHANLNYKNIFELESTPKSGTLLRNVPDAFPRANCVKPSNMTLIFADSLRKVSDEVRTTSYCANLFVVSIDLVLYTRYFSGWLVWLCRLLHVRNTGK